jgi:hypothetical protein
MSKSNNTLFFNQEALDKKMSLYGVGKPTVEGYLLGGDLFKHGETYPQIAIELIASGLTTRTIA